MKNIRNPYSPVRSTNDRLVVGSLLCLIVVTGTLIGIAACGGELTPAPTVETPAVPTQPAIPPKSIEPPEVTKPEEQPPMEAATANLCWVKSYGRGVGSVPGACEGTDNDGQPLEKQGLLCYPKCKPDYTGALFVCWQNCPAGFTNNGAFCAKPAGETREFFTAFNRDKCDRQYKSRGGCEKCSDGLYYPKCKPGMHTFGCPTCTPDCPAGMTDIGVSCAKNTYVRKTHLPKCGGDKVYDAGLCYDKCKENTTGVGPVCWSKCPANMVDCGLLCGKSREECLSAVKEKVVAIGTLVANAAKTIAKAVGTSGASLATDIPAALQPAPEQSESEIPATAKQEKEAAGQLKSLAASVKKTIKTAIPKNQKLSDALSAAGTKGKELLKIMDSFTLGATPETKAETEEKVKEMIDKPDSFDYAGFFIKYAPADISGIIKSFNHPICK